MNIDVIEKCVIEYFNSNIASYPGFLKEWLRIERSEIPSKLTLRLSGETVQSPRFRDATVMYIWEDGSASRDHRLGNKAWMRLTDDAYVQKFRSDISTTENLDFQLKHVFDMSEDVLKAQEEAIQAQKEAKKVAALRQVELALSEAPFNEWRADITRLISADLKIMLITKLNEAATRWSATKQKKSYMRVHVNACVTAAAEQALDEWFRSKPVLKSHFPVYDTMKRVDDALSGFL